MPEIQLGVSPPSLCPGSDVELAWQITPFEAPEVAAVGQLMMPEASLLPGDPTRVEDGTGSLRSAASPLGPDLTYEVTVAMAASRAATADPTVVATASEEIELRLWSALSVEALPLCIVSCGTLPDGGLEVSWQGTWGPGLDPPELQVRHVGNPQSFPFEVVHAPPGQQPGATPVVVDAGAESAPRSVLSSRAPAGTWTASTWFATEAGMSCPPLGQSHPSEVTSPGGPYASWGELTRRPCSAGTPPEGVVWPPAEVSLPIHLRCSAPPRPAPR